MILPHTAQDKGKEQIKHEKQKAEKEDDNDDKTQETTAVDQVEDQEDSGQAMQNKKRKLSDTKDVNAQDDMKEKVEDNSKVLVVMEEEVRDNVCIDL